jgi:hypothetical protein
MSQAEDKRRDLEVALKSAIEAAGWKRLPDSPQGGDRHIDDRESGIYPIEGELCDSCGERLEEDLLERDVTRDYDRNPVIHHICRECDAIFWTADVLSRTEGVEEAEIVSTLAFTAHAGQRPLV